MTSFIYDSVETYRNEWEYLVGRFSTNNRNLGRMVGTVTSQFTSQIRLDEVYFELKP